MRSAAVSVQAASLISVILLLPAFAAAQEPVASFDQLNTRLRPGDTVWVTDAEGREVKGKIRDLTPASLLLDAGGPRALRDDEVRFVRTRRHDSLANGAAYGAAVGAIAGIGLVLGACGSEGDCDTVGAAGWLLSAGIFGAAGAGVGVGIDALSPGPKQIVYRAPGSTRSGPGSQMALAPVVRRGGAGVALSVSF